ncbi:MAG: glycine zipper 2TM domain-containing protein [Proteobacteria bacterium]|nr:glycine zipper 2TM domain-containing protein [Pseudomonadota bacterium]
MRKTALILALLGLSATAWPPVPAEADHGTLAAQIPPGHFPPPGECRIWFSDRPAGHQPPPGPCGTLRYNVPPGARLIYGGPGRGGGQWLAEPEIAAPEVGYRARYPDIDTGTCNRGLSNQQLFGGALGAIVGGLLGSKVGKGSGKLAATAAGTLLGALAGASIAQSMDTADNECISKALDAAPDHKEIAWRNPDADAQYKVTPVRSYENRAGRYCREYITEAVIGGRTEKVYGTACRQPDGAWQVVS